MTPIYSCVSSNIKGNEWLNSFTSILIGIAIDQGLISSINESASNYLTEWQGDNREFITIRNLLDMRSTLTPTCGDRTTTSLYPCQAWASSGGALVYADDQLSACIQAQVADSGNQPWYNGDWQPGNFYYSNCDTQLLGEILFCLLYTSPSPRDKRQSRMPSSA